MSAKADVPAGGRWLGLGLGGRRGRGLGCRGLLVDPELMDMQPLELQVLDLQASNRRPADRQPADRQGTDSTGANGQRPECGRTDPSRWELRRRRLGPATLGLRMGRSAGRRMVMTWSSARQRSVPTFTVGTLAHRHFVVACCSPGSLHGLGWGRDGRLTVAAETGAGGLATADRGQMRGGLGQAEDRHVAVDGLIALRADQI
jgi:hypothetical protein